MDRPGRHLRERRRVEAHHRRQGHRPVHQRPGREADRPDHVRDARHRVSRLPHRAAGWQGVPHHHEAVHGRVQLLPVQGAGGEIAAGRRANGKRVSAPLNWPSFRGPDGTGVADGQDPPITWDGTKDKNIRWKTPIPGLGHSCPVVWGDRVFVTTAISSGQPNPKVRVGNYGDVESVNDTSKHTWQVLCLDRDSGKILWTRTAYEGVPKIKRHLKGSQANCTPATDGKHVVACFGSGRAVLLRLRRQTALEARPQHARFQLRRRPGIRMGLRQFAGALRRPLHSPVRPEPGFVHRRVQPGRRLEGLVHAAGRDSVVEFPGDLAELPSGPRSSPTPPSTPAATTRPPGRSSGGWRRSRR